MEVKFIWRLEHTRCCLHGSIFRWHNEKRRVLPDRADQSLVSNKGISPRRYYPRPQRGLGDEEGALVTNHKARHYPANSQRYQHSKDIGEFEFSTSSSGDILNNEVKLHFILVLNREFGICLFEWRFSPPLGSQQLPPFFCKWNGRAWTWTKSCTQKWTRSTRSSSSYDGFTSSTLTFMAPS